MCFLLFAVMAALLTSCSDNAAVALPPLPARLDALEPAVAQLVRETHAQLALEPLDSARWGRMAMVYEENRLLPQALATYEGALVLESESVRWRYRRAITIARLDRTEEAVEAMAEVLELRPDYGAAYWRLGTWQLELGDLAQARRVFERGTLAAPRSSATWAGLGRVALFEDDPDAAVAAFEQALVLRPADPYVEGLLAAARRARGELVEPGRGGAAKPLWDDPWEDALREFRAQTPRMVARVASLQGRPEEAVRILQEELERYPKDLPLLSHLGQAQYRAGDLEAAQRTFERCLALEPDNVGSYVNLVKIQHESGRFEDALATLDRAIEVRPAFGQLHRYRGELLFDLEQHTGAVPALARAIELDDRDPATRLFLARALCELGRAGEARTALEPLTDLDPLDADAWVVLALALAIDDKHSDAQDALRRAAEAGPQDQALFITVQGRLRHERGADE